MEFRSALLASISIVGVSLGAAAPAFAQTAAASARDNGVSLGEIVVTAQRRTENIQDVPLAVTAFSPQQVQAAQIQNTADLVRYTPSVTGGLNTGTGSALTFYIRGLGSTEQIATFDVPVATYVDEIYYARQSANAVSLFDIDRVEVLRGPQGTLFGRNTTGGAVSITTRKPSDHFGFFAEGSYGSYDRRQLRGSVDMPVNDMVRTKVDAFYVKDHGYERDVTTGQRLNQESGWGVRGSARVLPTDKITWDVSVDYIDQEKTTIGQAPYDPHYVSRSGLRYHKCDGEAQNRLLNLQLGNCARVRTGGVTSNLAFETGVGTVSLITGYRGIGQQFAIDFFNGTGPLGGFVISDQVTNQQLTQEVKLVGSVDRLKYVAGAFYLDEGTKTAEVELFGRALLSDWNLYNHTRSYAGYAQGDFSVTDALTLTAGGRVTHERKTLHYVDTTKDVYPAGIIRAVGIPANRLTDANLVARGIPLEQSTTKFTPRVAVSYKIDPDKMLFVSATNGFKSGGWNTRVTSANSVTAFGPETAWSFEGGARTEWLEHRLRLNATVYHEDVKHLQLLSGFTSGSTTVFVTRNAGTLRATGLEVELDATPARGLNIFAAGSLAHSRYADIPPALGAGGVPCSSTPEPAQCTTTRDRPVRFPNQQANFGFSYNVPLEPMAASITFNAAASYSSSFWTSSANDLPKTTGIPYGGTTPITVPISLTPSTTTLNAGIVVRSDDKHWEAALECSNCTSEFYPTASLSGFGYYNDPRRITFRVRYSY